MERSRGVWKALDGGELLFWLQGVVWGSGAGKAVGADDARAALEGMGVKSFDRVGSGSNTGDLTSEGNTVIILYGCESLRGGGLFNKAMEGCLQRVCTDYLPLIFMFRSLFLAVAVIGGLINIGIHRDDRANSAELSKDRPIWLTNRIYDEYARQDRVPLPWSPVVCRGKTIKVWGRKMRWQNSLFPASIHSQGKEVLAAPISLVLLVQGKEYPVPLQNFRIVHQSQSRVDLLTEGLLQGWRFQAQMWVEFDGFLWITLRVLKTSKNRNPEGLKVIVPLNTKHAKLYQTFARHLVGWIPQTLLRLPWLADPKAGIVNFYHWFGDEDVGIGFTYTSLQYWAPDSEENFCTLTPKGNRYEYTINLVEQPVPLDKRFFQFGIQATPIKPLPPDYFMMKGSTVRFESWAAMNRLKGNIDMALVWPVPAGTTMQSLNDPYNVDSKALEEIRDFCHRQGIAFVGVAHCPHRISPLNYEFKEYAAEWKLLPENILEWEKVPHYMACGKSYSYRKWLFYGWAVENVLKLGLDGLYSDGWMAGQMGCNNPLHGCGWEDEKGKRHLTVPILEGREFNRAMCLFLEDHVRSPVPQTAPERPKFPRYHFWIHSWEFVPSVMGFATEWLTGEFAAYPLKGPSTLKPEGTYGKCLGLGLFRARCLSTNWGIPNLFVPLLPEGAQNPPTDRQTRMAFAWFLPHGVPIGILEYMNANTVVQVAEVFQRFGARKAQFFPAWRHNPYLKIEAPKDPEVMVAVWQHPNSHQILAVVSNLKVEKTMQIKLRWTGSQQPQIRDALTGESQKLSSNGKMIVGLQPESFRLLWMKW